MKVDALKNHPSTKLAKKLKSKHPKVMKSVIRQSLAPLVLAGPGTIASVIKKEGIQVGSKLKVLIYGAQQVEVLDNCSWYQLIPDCLEQQFEVEVVAYGRELSPHTTSQVKNQLQPGNHSRYMVIDELFDHHDMSEFDMAISFAHDPKALEHEEERQLMQELVANRVPVYLSHYTVFTAALSAYAHLDSGFFSQNQSFINHYSLPEDRESGLSWGSVIFPLQPSTKTLDPAALNGLTRDQVLQELAGVAMHLSKALSPRMAPILTTNFKNQLHLLEGVYLDLDRAVLHAINDDLSVQEVPQDTVTQYTPEDDANHLEKLIWGMLTVLHFSRTQYVDKEVVNA